MTVVFEVIDAPYPHVCALYRCACGAEATRSGADAGVPPPGWLLEDPHGRPDDRAVCPHCAGSRQRPS